MAELALWEREYAIHMRLIDRWKIRDIASALGCDRKTIERIFDLMPQTDDRAAAAIAATLGEIS